MTNDREKAVGRQAAGDRVRAPWWIGAIGVGLVFGLLATSEFMARSDIAVDGVVLSSEIQCPEKNKARCRRAYVIRDSTTQAVARYVAGPNDHSLAQNIPTGARVVKRRGQLVYWVDGRLRDDFPSWWYGGMLAVSMMSVLAGFVGLGRDAWSVTRPKREGRDRRRV